MVNDGIYRPTAEEIQTTRQFRGKESEIMVSDGDYRPTAKEMWAVYKAMLRERI